MLERNVVRSEVTLFEDVDLNSELLNALNSRAVVRATITEEHNFRYAVLGNEVGKVRGPICKRAAVKILGLQRQVVDNVREVETYLTNISPVSSKFLRNPAKKRPHWALQQQNVLALEARPKRLRFAWQMRHL